MVMSIIESNSKIYKPKLYKKVVNKLIVARSYKKEIAKPRELSDLNI